MLIGIIAPISACGPLNFAPDSGVDVVIIADQASSPLATNLVNSLGVNAQVIEFPSKDAVKHEMGHYINDYNVKVLAIAYQDTVEEFIANNPESSDQIRVSAAEEEEIEDNLNQLEAETTSPGQTNDPNAEGGGFVIPFFSGLMVGLIVGVGLGALLMKKKSA